MAKQNKTTENCGRRNFGTIRAKGPNCYEAQYRYKGERPSFTRATYEECALELDRIELEIKLEKHRLESNMTLGDFLEFWLREFVLNAVKKGTYASYKNMCRNHVIPELGTVTLKKLTVPVVQVFFNKKAVSGRLDKKSGGLSTKSIRNIRNMLNEALAKAVELNKMIYNPISGVNLPKYKKKEMRFLSYDEQVAIERVVCASSKVILYGILIDMYMGMRLGELMGLRWKNVHLDARKPYIELEKQLVRQEITPVLDPGTIIIRESNKTRLVLTTLKTDESERKLYIPPNIIPLFISIREWQQQQQLEFGPGYNEWGFLFINEKGEVYDPSSYTSYFRDTASVAGVKKVNFHCLRHTYACRALDNGVPVKTLQELMGHADIQTTFMYVHDDDEKKMNAADLMAEGSQMPLIGALGSFPGGTIGGTPKQAVVSTMYSNRQMEDAG